MNAVKRGNQGGNHWAAKQSGLTAEKVLEIRREYANGAATQLQLARKYGVSAANMSLIVRNKIWRHVPGEATTVEAEQ